MVDRSLSGTLARAAADRKLPIRGKLQSRLIAVATALLARLLGTADGPAVAAVAWRELTLILRSREWSRFVGMWLLVAAGLAAIPPLYRSELGNWSRPSGDLWYLLCGYALQAAFALAMVQWTIRRLRRDLYSARMDELLLTRCSAADIAMGEALASAIAALWLGAATFPICLFLAAMAGEGVGTALRLLLSLLPAGALGVWFGMGWGLAFTLRRTSAFVPLTQWWVMGPLIPLWVAWSALGFFPVMWALLGFVPGGQKLLGGLLLLLLWVGRQVLTHWNPFLAIGASAGLWPSTWLTDWLAMLLIALFMMRKSMDAVQLSLGTLGERDPRRPHGEDAWIHHDAHYFLQNERRRAPAYRDGGNPIAAFDVALGHRVYLHPFLWTVALMAYLFLLGWSLLVPKLGALTGTAAALLPATAALLLMSGGVAVSFGWERDQHRWPALASLPLSNLALALGKIAGVVRPTLWTGLLASFTALLLGARGALPMDVALWMALHVLIFPIALACVSATLALTTPTLAEALYRWAILGAIPTLATVLPHPIGGTGGIALPFTPPLLVLLLVLFGPTPELIRAAWIALGLEVVGTLGALVVLAFGLRRWTVGERD